jgi:catechol 2,3-dioxygenase-like lactoylglutathione lyase family enzyme
MAKVIGILETALYVEDVERASRFYQDLFGFERLFADARLCALNVAGKHVLLLFRKGASSGPNIMPGGVIPPHDGGGQIHFAFAIPAEELAVWEERLTAQGIPIESRVRMQYGGISLYFRDPDRHLVELATPGIWAIY